VRNLGSDKTIERQKREKWRAWLEIINEQKYHKFRHLIVIPAYVLDCNIYYLFIFIYVNAYMDIHKYSNISTYVTGDWRKFPNEEHFHI